MALSGISSRAIESREGPAGIDPYPEPLAVAFFFFLVFVAISYLQAGVRWPVLGEFRVEFLLGSLLTLFGFVSIARQGKDFEWTAVGGWALMLIILLAVMTAFSIDWTTSSDIFVDRVVKFAMLGLFMAAFITSPHRLRIFLLVFLLICGKMGQEGFVGTITGSMIWENQGVPRLHGTTPIYWSPNSFSGMAVGALPFVVFLYPLVSRKWQIALIVLTIFLLNIVLRTGSRTGYVAFVVGLAWLLMHARQRVRALAGIVLLGLLALPFLSEDYIGRAVSIFEPARVGEDTSTGQRMEILVDGWKIFKSHPFGVGVGAFPVIRQQVFGRYQDTHNLFLEVATNAGIQGLLLFLGMVGAIIASLRRTRRAAEADLLDLGWSRWVKQDQSRTDATGQHIRDLLWIRAASSAFLGFMIIRLALGIFGHDLYERYWWFAGGGAIALWNLTRGAGARTSRLLGRASPDDKADRHRMPPAARSAGRFDKPVTFFRNDPAARRPGGRHMR